MIIGPEELHLDNVVAVAHLYGIGKTTTVPVPGIVTA